MKLTPEQQERLWNTLVRNPVFDMQQILQRNIREGFNLLAEDKLIFDAYSLVERQIRIVSLELENLRKSIDNADFRPTKDKPTDAEPQDPSR